MPLVPHLSNVASESPLHDPDISEEGRAIGNHGRPASLPAVDCIVWKLVGGYSPISGGAASMSAEIASNT